jgi:hypothetical protein
VKTPDDGQRNCPKKEEFYSKNKFEKLVQLVGLIIRICHDARSLEYQNKMPHLEFRKLLRWFCKCEGVEQPLLIVGEGILLPRQI